MSQPLISCDAGNISSKKEYAYTTGTLGSATSTKSYSYGNSNWGDLLTAYNGSTVSSDAIGNILSDGTWTYTWEHGRELATMSSGGTTWTFTYDADGMRTKRTNGSTTYSYVYNGSQLSQMTVDGNTLYFAYDASGTPLSVTYNGTAYYYTTNLQGDITAILNTSGTAVVTYTYDAWGHILSTSGSMANTLGTHNPLRYRGYVYDTETDLYYLQSRYYNPQIGRFLNADVFVSTGQGLVSNNMFAYCLNNPILYVDRTGTKPFLFVWDYYYIHKQIQMRIVMQYGYAMEVYVTWDGGFGFLDLYDAVNNEYYEVKSKKQIQVGAHIEQMSNYDDSEVASWMFEDYIIDGSPSRGNNIEIEGSFEYNFYTVKYEYIAPGIIWYTVDTNTKRVTTAVAAGGAIVASALLSRIGKCAIDCTAVAY